ncbi:tRNA lysidine(34) synthetase TilS [Candidatus Fermentibacteria bacterium]|nr:tRNA lysidine(34) synthetase TilS [Candidatus Fermentibacteria bacterium]
MSDPVELSFVRTVKSRELLPEGVRVIAAVSGGSDSMALLHLLSSFGDHMGWDLSVLHIDHGMRPESSEEAEVVRRIAAENGLPFRLRKLSPPETGSVEDAFSRARQAIYEEEAGTEGLVAVGHTASDRAETVVMRLLEGSGPRGLSGMGFVGVGPVRRPLLGLTRGTLRDYLQRRGVDWLEDRSNLDTSLLRNKVRLELMPVLEEASPGCTERISSTAELLGSWRDYMDRELNALLPEREAGSDVRIVSRHAYREAHRALRLMVLWHLSGRPRKGLLEMEKTDRWLMSGKSGSHLLPGGESVVADGEELRFESPS